jgi:hypothetical protein
MSKYLTTNEILIIKDWRTDWEWQPRKADPNALRCSFCKSVMREDWQVVGEQGTLVSYICPNSCMRENRFLEKAVKCMNLPQRLNITHD